MRNWLRGNAPAPPEWALVLEAAGGDPLRAQEIEEGVSAEWWQRWRTWRNLVLQARQK